MSLTDDLLRPLYPLGRMDAIRVSPNAYMRVYKYGRKLKALVFEHGRTGEKLISRWMPVHESDRLQTYRDLCRSYGHRPLCVLTWKGPITRRTECSNY